VLVLDTGTVRLHRLVVGRERANCYVLEAGAEVVLLDPGFDADAISVYCSGLMPTAMLATHAHADHIGAAAALESDFDIPLSLHADETLRHACAYAKLVNGTALDIPTLKLFRRLSFGCLTVQHTPGHTAGSVVLYGPGFVCTGDTIISHRLTPTVRPQCPAKLAESLAWMRQTFSDDTIVYPGHGQAAPFGVEWRYNPTIRETV